MQFVVSKALSCRLVKFVAKNVLIQPNLLEDNLIHGETGNVYMLYLPGLTSCYHILVNYKRPLDTSQLQDINKPRTYNQPKYHKQPSFTMMTFSTFSGEKLQIFHADGTSSIRNPTEEELQRQLEAGTLGFSCGGLGVDCRIRDDLGTSRVCPGISGQIITTKPPVGHLKWFSKGIPPKSP